jgi:hypothetical protein
MIKEILNLNEDQANFIPKLPELGTCIVKDVRFPRLYILQVPSDLDKDPITQAEVEVLMKRYADGQMENFRKAEEELRSRTKPKKEYTEEDLQKIRDIIYPETRKILEVLKEKPFLYRTSLKSQKGVTASKFDTSIGWLIQNGFIRTTQCYIGRKKAWFYPLKQKAHDLLQKPRTKDEPSDHTFEHDYYELRVAEFLALKRLEPQIEYIPADHDESFEIKGKKIMNRIDVYILREGKHIAYEITRSMKTVIPNLYKCIVKLHMDEIHFVCEDDPDTEAVQKKIESNDIWQTIKKNREIGIFYRDIREFL